VLVTSIAALARRVFPRASFDARCSVVKTGATINRDATVQTLHRRPLAGGGGRRKGLHPAAQYAMTSEDAAAQIPRVDAVRSRLADGFIALGQFWVAPSLKMGGVGASWRLPL